MLFKKKLRVECAVSSVNMDSSTDRNMKCDNKRSLSLSFYLSLILCDVKGSPSPLCDNI